MFIIMFFIEIIYFYKLTKKNYKKMQKKKEKH